MNDRSSVQIKSNHFMICVSAAADHSCQCLDNFLTAAFCVPSLIVSIIVLNNSGLPQPGISKYLGNLKYLSILRQ